MGVVPRTRGKDQKESRERCFVGDKRELPPSGSHHLPSSPASPLPPYKNLGLNLPNTHWTHCSSSSLLSYSC